MMKKSNGFLVFDEDGNDVYEPREVIVDPENADQQERLDIEEEPQEAEEDIRLEEGVEVNDEEMKILEKIKEILKGDKIGQTSFTSNCREKQIDEDS